MKNEAVELAILVLVSAYIGFMVALILNATIGLSL